MSFDVSPDSYDRFMGRFSRPLAESFVDLVAVAPGQQVLDVGCGSGALTDALVRRVGADAVTAVDPSASLVASVQARYPSLDVRQAGAESLPFPEDAFDRVLAQLVVQFMSDPVAGIAEMARTAVPGGVVAASVWDHSPGGGGPLSPFWTAVRSLDPTIPDESFQAGVAEGQLVELFSRAGLSRVRGETLTVLVAHPTFDDWWDPYTLGVGPAGAYVAALDETGREQLRARCREMLPTAPFETRAKAWVAIATVT